MARNRTRLSRRALLSGAGAGALAAIAGCAEPRVDTTLDGDPSTSTSVDSDDVAEGSAYTEVYEAVIDSVAHVRFNGVVDRTAGAGDVDQDSTVLSDPPTEGEEDGHGSAFLYDEDHVVTNAHVVASGQEIHLQYSNGDWTGTRAVGIDYFSDLAVLEVDHVPDGATPLELSDERPVVGQEVLAVGNPLGLDGSMSRGIVSGVNRTVDTQFGDFSHPNMIQTDAAFNPGNSGGPLVDLNGAVVGIVHGGQGQNVGFAISAALADRVVPELIEGGEYHHSYAGIELLTVDGAVAEENDLDEAAGIIVTDVEADGPAEGVLEAGRDTVDRQTVQIPVGGDVIVAIDGEPIPDSHALSTFLALETTPGDTIEIALLRDGEETTVDLTLAERPQQ